MKKTLLVLMFISLLISGCKVKPDPVEPIEPIEPIDQQLGSMSLQEKIGQLFIIRIDGLDTSLSVDQLEDIDAIGITQLNEDLIRTLNQYPVGGFILFDKNIDNPQQMTTLINQLKQQSKIDPFISIDEEGGMVSRLANNPNFNLPTFDNMEAIGNTNDPSQAYQLGLTIGNYLKDYGFNLNFAPVADVNSNPNNPVIGARAFSNDPHIVAQMVTSAIQGFHEAGIHTSIKHFPGHGDTSTDSHFEEVTTEKTLEALQQLELIPFEAGIIAKTDMVMMAHILTPNITNDSYPASMSKEIHTVLRETLNFEGLIITDSMSMKAISDQYSAGEAAIQVFEAGGDIILMPANLKEAFDALVEHIQQHPDKEELLDMTVKSILKLKHQR